MSDPLEVKMSQPQQETWQQQYQNGFEQVEDLLEFLQLDKSQIHYISDKNFPIRVPIAFAQRMKKSDPNDPLLLQVLPLEQELMAQPGYSHDPVGEQGSKKNPIPGLLHKYYGRVLLTLTSACAIHCRYCFRRHFPYQENNPGTKGWNKALEYIQANPEIQEVILSGGDPLSIGDKLLAQFVEKLEKISHVKYLRIHTRLPIMIPDRVTSELLNLLRHTKFKKVILVLHCNHPNEIDTAVEQALLRLKQANIVLLNQAVLLNNVNNNIESLLALSYRLFDNAVLPYYLHLLDKVFGASHFDVGKQEAIELAQALIQSLPGYLVPKLVYESPEFISKVPVDLRVDNSCK